MAADGRQDAAVLQTDTHILQGGLGHCDVCRGRRDLGLAVVKQLTADGVDLHQLGIACGCGTDGLRYRFGFGQRCFCTLDARLQSTCIDLVQRLARLDPRAFGEQTLLQYARHLGADLCALRGFGAACQFAVQALHLRRYHDVPHWGAGGGAEAAGALLPPQATNASAASTVRMRGTREENK